MMRLMRPARLAALLIFPLALSFAPSALAQPGKKPDPKAQPQTQPQWKKKPGGKLDPKMAEAKRLFDEGATFYTEGNYEKAIESWEMSYEISKKELICESISNAYERLGQPKKAHEYLSRWRAAAPPEEHVTLDARLKNLEERMAREEEAERQQQAEREKREREGTQGPVAPPSSGPSIPGIVLAGAGGAAIVAGVVLDIVAAGKRPDESAACHKLGDRQLCRASDRDAIESSNRLAFVGDILWIGGSVAAAAGVVLLVTHGMSSSSEKPKTGSSPPLIVAPIVTPQGGGVGVVARF
jgi:tetratricopeptide (TPR) repeat protein